MHKYFPFFTRVKKLLQQRKLHHDKTIKLDFFLLQLKNGTLEHKFCTFYALWHHFKSHAKSSIYILS